MSDAAPIGVFDSGVGGLTVARQLVARLPGEALLYLGDTARVPYGNKSPETVQRYSLNIGHRLVDEGAKAVVVACNTASAFALDALRDALTVPVIGVVEPVAALAAAASHSGVIGVIGTRGTIASGAYARALRKHRPEATIIGEPCPLFVPLAEEGWVDGEVPRLIARRYLAAFAGSGVDTLILGCTHYPLLAAIIHEEVAAALGHEVAVMDSAGATVDALAALLGAHGLLAPPGAPTPQRRFWMTDVSAAFAQSWGRFFGAEIARVEHVDLRSIHNPLNSKPFQVAPRRGRHLVGVRRVC